MLRILVVEDNPELRETLALLLEEDDRYVLACGSAEEALREFERESFDVVVTDVNLPKMSGLDLATRVHETRPATWIVLSSGAAVPRRTGESAHKVRFLGKPYTLEALDALMEEIRTAALTGD